MTLSSAELKATSAIEYAVGFESPTSRGTFAYRMGGHYRNSYTAIRAEVERSYTQYLAGVSPDDFYTTMAKNNRLKKLNRAVTEVYRKHMRAADTVLANSSRYAVNSQYYLNQYAVNWFTPKAYFARLPKNVVNLSVFGGTDAWAKLTPAQKIKYKNLVPAGPSLRSTLGKKNTAGLARVLDSISNGFQNGLPLSDTAKNLLGAINTTASKALLDMRTETHRNQQAGAYAQSVDAQERGVPIVRIWDATLDDVTRATHADLDQTPENKDGQWESDGATASYPGQFGVAEEDINCRCIARDEIIGQPPQARRGRDPATGESDTMNYESFGPWAQEHDLRTNSYGQDLTGTV